MTSQDKAQRWFVIFIVVLLTAAGLYLRLGALVGGAYFQTLDEQYLRGCFSTYTPTAPDSNPFYSKPPSPEECANMLQEFCAHRPFREVILVSVLTLCVGGLLGLLALRQFKDKHKVLFRACLVLYLIAVSLVLLVYPMITYSALKVLYVDC